MRTTLSLAQLNFCSNGSKFGPDEELISSIFIDIAARALWSKLISAVLEITFQWNSGFIVEDSRINDTVSYDSCKPFKV